MKLQINNATIKIMIPRKIFPILFNEKLVISFLLLESVTISKNVAKGPRKIEIKNQLPLSLFIDLANAELVSARENQPIY